MATLTRKQTLARYLGETPRTPFAWGRHDCCMWLADWVLLMRGIDPAAELRGKYHDEAGGVALIESAGGVPVLVGRCCRLAGLAETGSPQVGDIGLVQVGDIFVQGTRRTGSVWVGAICTGPRWAMLVVGGLVSLRVDHAIAWSV